KETRFNCLKKSKKTSAPPSLIEKYHEMEEKIFYSNLSNRIDEGPIELIPAAKVIEKEDTENPFAHLSDEELFD
ncbi:hypothetical protein, partial [Marinilactibacillus psychrotolerans]|uniref:hypothetical protein n=1 Tax=Marinilactibacillus psychrotolerans TaxID=191770 RepID=UPI001C4E587E